MLQRRHLAFAIASMGLSRSGPRPFEVARSSPAFELAGPGVHFASPSACQGTLRRFATLFDFFITLLSLLVMPRARRMSTRSAARRADAVVTDKAVVDTPPPENRPSEVVALEEPPPSPPVADPPAPGEPVCSPDDVVGFPPLSANSEDAPRRRRPGRLGKARRLVRTALTGKLGQNGSINRATEQLMHTQSSPSAR